MTYDTLSTIGTLIFYVVLIAASFVTGRWLVSKERNY
jgi:hypothetical protein